MGASGIEISDKNENIAFEEGGRLYVRDSSGTIEEIGSVWMIDHETNRRQYNFYFNDYMVSLSNLEREANAAEILIIYKSFDEYTSFEAYRDFRGAEEARLDIRPNKASVFLEQYQAPHMGNSVTLSPSESWSEEELSDYNMALIRIN